MASDPTIPSPPTLPRTGELYDRGYRHYEGPREGREHAIRALVLYSIKRGLGVKKKWTAKIIPILMYGIAFVPVLIFIGVRAILGDAAGSFDYVELYSALSLVLLVFAAATAPEMLSDDRRQNVLPLYFSRPIHRSDYLLAKIGALGILMATIAFIPAFVLFLGTVFLDDNPIRYLIDNWGDLFRIAGTGALMSIYYAAIGLVIAAFTERKSIAAAIYVGAMLILSGISAALFSAIEADWGRYLVLLSPDSIPDGISKWIFSPPPDPFDGSLVAQANLSGIWYLVMVVVITLISGTVMYQRYLKDE